MCLLVCLSSIKSIYNKTFMHTFFYLFAVACSIFSAQAQDCSIKKGYAYQRTTIPGNIPRKTLDEGGKVIEAPVKMMNTYFVYVETTDCNLKATRIWLGGKAYHVTQEEVVNMPVVIQHSHPGTAPDTLVKQTNNKVYRIQPKEEWQLKPGKKIIKMQKESKIIIEYTHKSVPAFYKIQDIKRIAPVVLQ
jgi:hypothetical protein